MRHSKKLRDTRIWEIYSQKVLDEDQGYSRLGWVEEVFEVSTNYLSLVRDTFPNYTLHNERHVLNVIDIMGGLLGDQISNLTCAEAELLILVACLRDLKPRKRMKLHIRLCTAKFRIHRRTDPAGRVGFF